VTEGLGPRRGFGGRPFGSMVTGDGEAADFGSAVAGDGVTADFGGAVAADFGGAVAGEAVTTGFGAVGGLGATIGAADPAFGTEVGPAFGTAVGPVPTAFAI
jgi:hypothetical protein